MTITKCLYSQIEVLSLQTEKLSLKKTSSDCENAIHLKIGSYIKYGPTGMSSYGTSKEISEKNNTFIFKEEHATSWYLLEIESDGDLCFEVFPYNSISDYDFVIFPYIKNDFCAQFKNKSIIPIRSNLANNKFSQKGKTGISLSGEKNRVPKGPHNPYSRSLHVKRGEQYMLILDNVTVNGEGHIIEFSFQQHVKITGKITNENNMPISAEISLFDPNGNLLEKINNQSTGDYQISTIINENRNYNLIFSSEGTFFQSSSINTVNLKDSFSFPNIITVLPELKTGLSVSFKNLNFIVNKDELLPGSYPLAKALLSLMKNNDSLEIIIEGHTNGSDWEALPKYQSKSEKKLSEDRAKTVSNYLFINGIEKYRVSTSGYGSTKPIYKNAKSEVESVANRRVEIKIIKFLKK
jgi:outer membrane protein OmpA-like peptidoglycan-associated protein